jgi:hypothetical protein
LITERVSDFLDTAVWTGVQLPDRRRQENTLLVFAKGPSSLLSYSPFQRMPFNLEITANTGKGCSGILFEDGSNGPAETFSIVSQAPIYPRSV